MKLVLTLLARDEVDIVDAHIAYHLNAGVDFVLATDHDSRDGTTEILESYARDGYVRLFREQGELRESEQRTRMARLAATEHDADWIIDSSAGEFWWPRAESLKDALVAIPQRYTVAQALVRRFLHRSDDGRPLAERMTVRLTLRPPRDGEPHAPEKSLRPVYRADPQLIVLPQGVAVDSWRVPLRAWYPIEVFDYSNGNAEAPVPLEDAEIERGLSDGSLVVDTRLADALGFLREAGATEGRAFARPVDGAGRLVLPVPDIVDDAAYAVECAALGEVDFGPIERHIEDLEHRIAVLEARFWPWVRRSLRRLDRRRR